MPAQTVSRGELVAVVGEVGAGKSSLLLSIVGEMLRREPNSIRSAGAETAIGFMGQSAAIINGTIEVSAIFIASASFQRSSGSNSDCAVHFTPAMCFVQ